MTSHKYPESERYWRERHFPPADETLFSTLAEAPAQLNPSERLTLFTLVRSLSPSVAVEIGTFRGGSALIIVAAMDAARHGQLWCVDPRPKIAYDWNRIAHRAHMVEAPSPGAIDIVAGQIPGPIDFAFIDGIHLYDNVVADTKAIIPHLAAEATILYHDATCDVVRRAIDDCLDTVPGLSDGGIICRYFNNELWPRTLVGGMRLLSFRDTSREQRFPIASSTLVKKDAEFGLSPDDEARVRRQLEEWVATGKTPIAIHGSPAERSRVAHLVADFDSYVQAIIDDDPLAHGNACRGWPIVGPREHARFGIRAVLSAGDRQPSWASQVEEKGVAVATPCRDSQPSPRSSVSGTFASGLEELFLQHGTRAIGLFGSRSESQALGGDLVSGVGRFVVTAWIDAESSESSRRLWNLPAVTLRTCDQHKPSIEWIVASSPSSEKRLLEQQGDLDRRGIRVHRIWAR